MSLADDKRNVFTTIGSYSSLIEDNKKPKRSDSFSSVNNKDDVIPFLLDVLKTVAGTEVLKELIGGMFTKLIDDAEPQLKTALKKQFIQSNADQNINGTVFLTDGINVPVKDIDVYGKYKVNPASDGGNLIYGSSTSFDSKAYNAIVSGSDGYNNLSIQYNQTTDSFIIKPTSGNQTVGDFFNNYIDNTQLIDKKELVSNVMDNIYGTLSSKQEKTIEQTYEELQIEKMLEQLLENNDSFDISQQDYDVLLQRANELTNGVVNYDMGCGMVSASLAFNDFDNLVKNISGSTDPFAIGNAMEATIDDSIVDDSDVVNNNKQTIKDGFFQKIIKIFTIKMLQAVTTAPQIRVLFGIMSSLQNNGVVSINKPTDDMKKFKIVIKCMSKEIMKLVAAFIFALAVSYIVKLLKPVIKRVIKEKINQYIGIIKSLTGANKLTN